jgi:hypothetical protein
MHRSVGAVLAGLVAVIALSLATDVVLHALDVYPPWGEPMNEPAHNLLALTYRSIYAVAGSYIAARLAPHAPIHHAMALGVLGLVLSTAGLIATWNMGLGPRWLPIALVLAALPCAWFGGVLHRMQHTVRES